MKRFLILFTLCFSFGHRNTDCPSLSKNVTFRSVNFEHILHWEALPGDTAYSVQYKRYGENKWLLKNDCQNIMHTFCNLTLELDNLTEQYNAKVIPVSKNCTSEGVTTKRFSPKQTAFGHPALNYVANVHSIKFVIQPPYIPLRSRENGYQLTLESIYKCDIFYHLVLCNLKTNKQWKIIKKEKEIELLNLDPDTEYNGTVFFTIQKSAEKSQEQAFLARTLPDTTWLQFLLGGLAFSFGLLILIICYVGYKYIQHPRKQPESLDFKGMTPFQPMNLSKGHMCNSSINNFSRPGDFSSAPFPAIGLQLSNTTESPHPLSLPGNAYRSQTVCSPALLKSSAPKDQSPFTSCSQLKQKHIPDGSCKDSSLTYGVCAEVSCPVNHAIYRSNQVFTNTQTDGISLAKVKAPQYQCQTQIPAAGFCESHPFMKAKTLGVLSYQPQLPQETRVPLNNSQLLLQTERKNGELHLPLLLSVLEEDTDSSGYRPHPTGLLSLFSTVKVVEDWPSDGGLDEQPPSPVQHSVAGTNGALTDESKCVFLDSLTRAENDLQYRVKDSQTVIEQLKSEQSYPQIDKTDSQHSYKQNNPSNMEPFFRNLYI